MKILITGSAGFIGSATMKHLIKHGEREVVGVDAFCSDTAHRLSYFRARTSSQIESATKNMLIETLVFDELMQEFQPEIIFHFAATPGVRESFANPVRYFDNNMLNTVRIAELAVKAGTRRIIFASTSSVYNWDRDFGPVGEDGGFGPSSPYGLSKLQAESALAFYANHYDIEVIVLRYFSVFGPWGRPDMLILKAIRRILNNEPVILHGRGDQFRDYTYIDDVVSANIRAMSFRIYPQTKQRMKWVDFNIGSGNPIKINEAVRMIGEACGIEPKIEYQGNDPSGTMFTYADWNKARQLLDWAPIKGPTVFKYRLEETVEWYKANRKKLEKYDF